MNAAWLGCCRKWELAEPLTPRSGMENVMFLRFRENEDDSSLVDVFPMTGPEQHVALGHMGWNDQEDRWGFFVTNYRNWPEDASPTLNSNELQELLDWLKHVESTPTHAIVGGSPSPASAPDDLAEAVREQTVGGA